MECIDCQETIDDQNFDRCILCGEPICIDRIGNECEYCGDTLCSGCVEEHEEQCASYED